MTAVRELNDQEVADILQKFKDRRPRFLSETERLIESVETLNLKPEDVMRLIAKSKKGGEKDGDV
jgi:HPt (histidine-containing phosphotransfer) domain-containing protein